MMTFEWGRIQRIVLIFCGFVLAGSFSGCAFGPRVLEKTHGRYQESVRQVDEDRGRQRDPDRAHRLVNRRSV